MAELNRAAAEAMIAAGVTAATDITGFGLVGHLSEMAAQSGVRWRSTRKVPVFEGVLDSSPQGVISGGSSATGSTPAGSSARRRRPGGDWQRPLRSADLRRPAYGRAGGEGRSAALDAS